MYRNFNRSLNLSSPVYDEIERVEIEGDHGTSVSFCTAEKPNLLEASAYSIDALKKCGLDPFNAHPSTSGVSRFDSASKLGDFVAEAEDILKSVASSIDSSVDSNNE